MTVNITAGGDPNYLTRQVGRGAEHYFMNSIGLSGEPPGFWWGAGAADMGLTGQVDAEVMEKLYGDLRHPETGEQLGRRPRVTKALGERLAAALAELPADATAEERRAVQHQVRATQTRAVKFFDVTYSAPKSWSLLHAGFQVKALRAREAGDEKAAAYWQAHADAVRDSFLEGVRAGLDYLQETAGHSRAGRNGVRRVPGKGFIAAVFLHHTSRDGDPQLHAHVGLVNRQQTEEVDPVTGEVVTTYRTLDGRAVYASKRESGVIEERTRTERLARRLGVLSKMRPDGKAREILGVDPQMIDQFSSRSRTIKPEVDRVAAEYRRKTGRSPSVYRLRCIAQEISLRTRRRKKAAEPREDLLRRWTEATRDALEGVPDEVFAASRAAGVAAEPFDRDLVIARALEQVQSEKATFTRSDVLVALDRQLPDYLGGLDAREVRALFDDLVADALTPWRSEERPGRPAVVRLTVPDLAAVPDELKLADGRSRYAGSRREIYTTDERLSAEDDIVEAAAEEGAPAVAAEIVESVVDGSGLAPGQASAVHGIATSGRFVDVLVGPAGTGKSHTVGRLCEAWEADGGEVLGLAVGQRQANVLAEEGVTKAANVRMFLHANEMMAAGSQVRDADLYRIRPGQLVVIDEAATCSTDDLLAVLNLARRGGAKVLLLGDFAQTTAIGAGGMFGHLAATLPHVHTLDQVHRFHSEWERDASLRLRAGDTDVLVDYDARGRIHHGTAADMAEKARNRWMVDYLTGRDTVLITSTNAAASESAGLIRADLVRYGKVEREGVRLRDGNVAGRGDRVQLRVNDRGITTEAKEHWAANRDVVTVRARGADGSLTVAYPDGSVMDLPAEYVRDSVELAYAVTVHAIQAATVDSGHVVFDPRMSREQFYVAMSRGRAENHAYVPTDEPGTARDERPPWEPVIGRVMRRSEQEHTALRVMRDQMDAADALDRLAPEWADLVEGHYEQKHGKALLSVFGPDRYRAMRAEEEYGELLNRARQAEERGMDAARLLARAAVSGPFDDARSVSAVMHWRLGGQMAIAEENRAEQSERVILGEAATGLWGDEAEVRARHAAVNRETEKRRSTYAARTPDIPGAVGDHVRHLAELMDARVQALGERAAAAPPAWLTARLGEVPREPLARAAWVEAAAAVSAFRERSGYASESDAIGPRPPARAVDKHAAWSHAAAHLGVDGSAGALEAASDAELRGIADRARRELDWAPPYVADRLRAAHEARAEARTQQVRLSSEVVHTAGVAERRQLREHLADAQKREHEAERLARTLERVHNVRAAWARETRDAREQGRVAQEILDRRHPEEAAPTAAPPPNADRRVPVRQARREAARAERIMAARGLAEQPSPTPHARPTPEGVGHPRAGAPPQGAPPTRDERSPQPNGGLGRSLGRDRK